MSSVIDALRGAQQPRLLHVPDYVSSTGEEACELAEMVGLDLDPWQRLVLQHGLGERPDGKWAAFEVGVEVPRQNGKGGILEARALAGLFLLGEGLIIHSAHEFATAEEALERMAMLLEGSEDLSRRVKTIKRSHGQEGVYLKNGQRLRYKTRTKGGGRGFSADCVILDEAMVIPEAMHGALMPTLSAGRILSLVHGFGGRSREDGARRRVRAVPGSCGPGDDPSSRILGGPPFDRPSDVPPSAARTRWCGLRRIRRSASGSRRSTLRRSSGQWIRGRSLSSVSASVIGRGSLTRTVRSSA
jgi:hypothetical protein